MLTIMSIYLFHSIQLYSILPKLNVCFELKAGQRTFANYSTFCSAKAGLDMLTKTMAVELGPQKIKVNSVCLGCVWTPAFEKFIDLFGGVGNMDAILAGVKQRTPLGDPLLPMDDVVNTILFVLSDLTTTMTGENVVLDGGFCAT